MNNFLKSLTLVLTILMQVFGIMDLPFSENSPVLPIDSQNGGDPCIVEDGGKTYYTFTTGGGIDIREIVSFEDTTSIRQKTVYSHGNDSIVGDIWAPEIHKIGDKWYILACARFDEKEVPAGSMPEAKTEKEHGDYYRYGFVLESKTDDIFGEYEFKARLSPNGLNNIDGTYLKKDGKLYYICSAYVDIAHQCIFVSEMENPYTLKDGAVMLSRPTYPWEKNGWSVNEGPAVLYKDDKTYIVYSASGYSSGNYCMGMLTLCGDDAMEKASWSKKATKVYGESKKREIYHTGHCSFLYRENGDIYMVYHATNSPEFFSSPRCTYLKKLEFTDKNYPLFNS